MIAWAHYVAKRPPTGTINCLALNSKGEMSGTTTTSGLAWKIPGRVGDSPIIGAGLYVDQEVGAAGSTGRGEENIRMCGAHSIVENMRHGMAPKEACMDALKRIVRNFNGNQKKLNQFDINFYALRKDGQHAGALTLERARPPGRLHGVVPVCGQHGRRFKARKLRLAARTEGLADTLHGCKSLWVNRLGWYPAILHSKCKTARCPSGRRKRRRSLARQHVSRGEDDQGQSEADHQRRR